MDKLKENLPLMSAGLLLLSFTNLVNYYHFFHIDIVTFIDLSEVLQLQFEFLTIGFLFIIFWIGHSIITLSTAHKSEIGRALIYPVSMSIRKNYKKYSIIFKYRDSLAFLFYAIFPSVAFVYEWRQGVNMKALSDLAVMLFAVSFVLLFTRKFIVNMRRIKQLSGVGSVSLEPFFIVLILMAATTIYSKYAAFSVMTKEPDYEASIVFADHTVATNKNLIYVGKSKGYVFLYNKDTDQAEVISTGDIKQVRFSPGLHNVKVPKPYRTKYYHGPR
jgi:hypothetical protein